MDISQLKRDPERIKADLQKVGGDRVVTKKGCRIYIPSRYRENQFAKIANETYILGLFGIVSPDGYYSVSRCLAMVKTEPSVINIVTVDDTEYMELVYEPGNSVIANTDIVQSDDLLYEVYNEFIARGNVPWYMDYYDLGKLFEMAKYYCGVKLGANHVILEMLAATVSRDPKDPVKYYRQVVKTQKDVLDNPPKIIKLDSVTYGATNTTAKLIGAYWDEGVTSALVNQSDKLEPIEDLLRR